VKIAQTSGDDRIQTTNHDVYADLDVYAEISRFPFERVIRKRATEGGRAGQGSIMHSSGDRIVIVEKFSPP
jgi:hypothetical protein